MATQYTGGLTAGQVLTAATMNQLGAVWETWTPGLSQSNNIAVTVNYARYARIQKIVLATAYITSSGAGTAANGVLMTLPITPQSNNGQMNGWGWIYDANVTTFYNVTAYMVTSTQVGFISPNATGGGFGVNPAVTVAASDQFRVAFMYEAA